jgi:guanyl-specific ribonuclease Sa
VGPRLVVDPVTYDAASMAFGTEIAGQVSRACLGLLDELAGCVAMAGSDPAGRGWADAYDEAAALTVGVTADVVNGCYQLAALLQQTGFNYSRAESWSTPGSFDRLPDQVAYASCSAALGRPPSSAGGALPLPSGWWLIEHAVGYVWPGGHQDRLRAAAAAWAGAALAIGDATLFVQDALECIAAQVSPEVDDAMTACQAMDKHLWELVAAYRGLSGACSEFAGHIDKAHSDVEHELVSLLEWSAGIQTGGLLLTVLTAGFSEAGAQGMQAERIAATAAKVRSIIAHLVEMAGLAAKTISGAAARTVKISRDLKGLLGTRLSVVTVHEVDALPAVAKTAEAVAVSELRVAATLDLSLVPEGKREIVIATIARAKSGTISFTKHDGKPFENWKNELPVGRKYQEWVAAAADTQRGLDRVIFAGSPEAPVAIYYWDHVHAPIQIGP